MHDTLAEMTVTAEALRSDLEAWLDKVLATGQPLHIERHGKTLLLLPDKFSNVPKRPCIVGDPDELVHLDWSAHWSRDLP